MASRSEERERRRAERLAAERAESGSERRRLLAGYIVAGGMTLAVIVGLVIVLGSGGGGKESGDFPENAHVQAQSGFDHGVEPDDREGTPPPELQVGDLEEAAKAAKCELERDLPNEGSDHIPLEDGPPGYKTDPPTSGDHFAEQMADGAWAEQPNVMYTVHSMEHGRVAIQYSPDLSEDEQLELKGVFDESPAAVLFFPNPEMPYDVAATAWTQLIGCEAYEGTATLDAIRDFRDIHRGQGPEDVPLVTG